MKHSSYRAGVAWIARNVSILRLNDPDRLLHPMASFDDAGCTAVGLLAELFGVDMLCVAGDVLRDGTTKGGEG